MIYLVGLAAQKLDAKEAGGNREILGILSLDWFSWDNLIQFEPATRIGNIRKHGKKNKTHQSNGGGEAPLN